MERYPVSQVRNLMRVGTVRILYVYSDQQQYIENLLSFVLTGLEFGQQVILIESSDIYNIVSDKLSALFDATKLKSAVHHIVNESKSGQNDTPQRLVHELSTMRQNCPENTDRRVWSHVESIPACAIFNQYARLDTVVSVLNGNSTSAKVQNEMLRYHKYLMTDEVCTLSPFTHTGYVATAPHPSELQHQVNLYKLKSDFINVISHEVRNPVTIIKGYTSLLANGQTVFSDQDRDKLQTISDCADIIEEEMQNILYTERFLSGQEVWRVQAMCVSPAIDRVLRAMAIKSKLENIRFKQASNLVGTETLSCNELALRLILSNVIGNAIKYSREGGTVQVDIHFDHNGLRVVVADDGIGMSPDQLQQLFRKYGKMEYRKEGQGIGLYTVKTLVDKLEGTIEVTSEYSKGTQVTISLPPEQHHMRVRPSE